MTTTAAPSLPHRARPGGGVLPLPGAAGPVGDPLYTLASAVRRAPAGARVVDRRLRPRWPRRGPVRDRRRPARRGQPHRVSTIDRLKLSRAVLADHLDPPAPAADRHADADAHSVATRRPTPHPRRRRGPAPVGPSSGRSRPDRARAARPRAGDHVQGPLRVQDVPRRDRADRRTAQRRPRRDVSIAAGSQRTFTVRLNATGRRLLARRGRLRASIRITLAGATLAQPSLTLRHWEERAPASRGGRGPSGHVVGQLVE